MKSNLKVESLDYNSTATQCPLCENDFDNSDVLASRINKEVSQLVNSLQVEELEKRQQEIKMQSNSKNEINTNLSMLLQLAIQFYENEKIEDYSMSRILLDCRNIETKIKDINIELERQLNFRSKLNSQGFNQQELTQIRSKLNNVFGDLRFDSNGLSKFRDLQSIEGNELSDLSVMVNKNNQLLRKNDDDFRKVLSNFSISSSENHEGLKKLRDKKSISDQAVIHFNKISSFFEFRNEDDIELLNLRIEGLMNNLAEIRRIQGASDQRIKAEKLKIDSEAKKKKIEPKIERLDRALDVANEILGNQDEEEVLKDFINSNSKEISEIFSSIHTPHEFTEISFYDNRIFLKHIDNKTRSIKEISSGQRSALVLSVF